MTAAPSLYLPGRYRKETEDQERPKDYVEVGPTGRLYVICNAETMKDRIPRSELQDMMKDRMAKAKKRGDAQKTEDVNAALQAFWGERREWIRSRANHATRFGWVHPTR